MESWEIGRCQSSPPCRASTACPPTGITGHKTDLESQKLGSCFGAARKHLYKFPSAIPFDKPGWCWAWSASPAENGPQHHVHSTICAWPEGCLWTICCCLPPVWTRGHRQKGWSSQQPWWFNFYFAFHYTATTYWHAQKTAEPNSAAAKQFEKYLKVSRRNLIMFCRSSCSSVTSALWNDCPNKEGKESSLL